MYIRLKKVQKTFILLIFTSIFFRWLVHKRFNNDHIPKIIWSFWDSTEFPDTVSDCVKSWKLMNPTWKVVILNNETVLNYLDVSHDIFDSMARKSDYIRLVLLAKYGGVWLDATIITTSPIDSILNPHNSKRYEFIGFFLKGYTTSKKFPVIESWFLASPKNSQFLLDWKNEFENALSHPSFESYIDDLRIQKIDLQNIWNPIYLAIHCAAQKILQTNLQKYNLFLYTAESGPYKYKYVHNWDSYKGLRNLCLNPKESFFPVVKFTKIDRTNLESNKILRNCIFINVYKQTM